MPQIPALPIDEPVAKPQASPAQFGSVGETIAGMGEETERLAQANLAFEGHLIYANRQLKAKQAEVNYAMVLEQIHTDLSKAVTPEDVDRIQADGKVRLSQTLEPYAAADHVLGRELGIFGQQQDVLLQHTANVKKADLIDKGTRLTDKALFSTSIRDAINSSAAGEDYKPIENALRLKLENSESAGVYMPQEVEAIMQEFGKEREAGYVDAQLSSSNASTVQETVNDLRLHPDKFPHLDKGEINALANKGENNIVSMLSRNDDITAHNEVNKYWNQSPTGIPKMFTDGNGNFDQGKAMTYVSTLGLSPAGEKALIGDIKTHGIASSSQLEQQAAKAGNEIVAASQSGNWRKANELLSQFKIFADQHTEFADTYKSYATFEDARRAQQESDGLRSMGLQLDAERLKMDQWQFDSFETFGNLGKDIQEGKYTDNELRNMVGRGKGKMLPPQVTEVIELSHALEKDPSNKPYISGIWNDTALAPDSQARAVSEFRSWLRENPKATDDQKQAKARSVVEPVHVDEINKRIDKLNNDLNGNPNDQPGAIRQWWQNINRPATPAVRPAAKSGTKTFTDDDGTPYHIPENMVDEFKKDHPNATAD